MPALQILGGAASNFVWAARIACAEKGVPYELVPARPHSPEVLTANPLGKIPAMRHGEVTLFETKAICTYIDRAFAGPGLIPAGAEGAALVEQWVSFVTTAFDPVCMRQYVLSYIFPNTPDKSPDRAVIDAALPKMEKLLGTLDAALAKTAYVAGPAFTLADAFALPIVNYLTRFPESAAMLAKNAHLHAWFKRVIERPSVVATMPPPPPK